MRSSTDLNSTTYRITDRNDRNMTLLAQFSFVAEHPFTFHTNGSGDGTLGRMPWPSWVSGGRTSMNCVTNEPRGSGLGQLVRRPAGPGGGPWSSGSVSRLPPPPKPFRTWRLRPPFLPLSLPSPPTPPPPLPLLLSPLPLPLPPPPPPVLSQQKTRRPEVLGQRPLHGRTISAQVEIVLDRHLILAL